jgi:hypothetical protein
MGTAANAPAHTEFRDLIGDGGAEPIRRPNLARLERQKIGPTPLSGSSRVAFVNRHFWVKGKMKG